MQTSIGFEREILKDLSVEASFIDNRGVWLESDGLRGYNQLPPSALAKLGFDVTNPNDFNLLTQPISSPSVAARGFTKPYSTFPSGASLAQALRPFPQFGSVTDQYERDGNTWYDALQVKVTKRLGNGLSGGLGYVWSKDLGTVSSTGTYTTSIPIQDPTLPPKSQKSYLAIDLPQMLNFYFNYEVPTIQLYAKRLEACIAFGLDSRRHLPLPERLSDANTEFNEHPDFGDFWGCSLGESRSRPAALLA